MDVPLWKKQQLLLMQSCFNFIPYPPYRLPCIGPIDIFWNLIWSLPQHSLSRVIKIGTSILLKWILVVQFRVSKSNMDIPVVALEFLTERFDILLRNVNF